MAISRSKNRCERPDLIRNLLLFSATLFSLGPEVLDAQTCHPGVAQLARGDYASALQSLAAVARSEASNASLLNSRGVAELLNGKISEAIATFDRVLASDPNFHEARFNRGIALLKKSSFAQAGEAFVSVYEKSEGPLRARAAYHHALADDGRKDLKSATEWLLKAHEADPSLSEAKLYRGVLLERQRQFVKAGEAYRDYLTDEPKSIIAKLRFGVVAQRAGYVDTAKRYLKIVIDEAPTSMEAAEARKFLVMWE